MSIKSDRASISSQSTKKFFFYCFMCQYMGDLSSLPASLTTVTKTGSDRFLVPGLLNEIRLWLAFSFSSSVYNLEYLTSLKGGI